MGENILENTGILRLRERALAYLALKTITLWNIAVQLCVLLKEDCYCRVAIY